MEEPSQAASFPFEKLLEWPFLTFVILLIIGFRFHKEISERLSSISELTLGGKTKITLGSREVEARNIGDALTQAFQELESRVEAMEASQLDSNTKQQDQNSEALLDVDEIPDGLREFLWSRVYKMLNSDYWYARYVDTLASNTKTSEALMLSFLQSRPDVEVFQDGNRWVASLKSRSKKRRSSPKK
ncbi:MAG: hypothetical protein ABJ360_25670 [Roseobacter sp.]|uniref:hypothetical protein n=1 Tax=Roseibium sp. TaxID=1936156 RepID=UPI003267F0EA